MGRTPAPQPFAAATRPAPNSRPAAQYRPALERYCEDGRIEIDNSAAERALRGVSIGRRSYPFAGADSGGERAAAMYSLIGTVKLNGVGPGAWLRHVLAHIADHPVNRVDGFLPWHCAGQLPAVRNTPLPSGGMPSSFNSLTVQLETFSFRLDA